MDYTAIVIAIIGFLGTIATIIPTVLTGNKKIEKKLDDHIKKDEEEMANTWRVRILRFDDDLCDKTRTYPSEANFAQVMGDIDKYRTYMSTHPDFHNGIGEAAMAHIHETYMLCRNKGLFGCKHVDIA